MVLVVSDQVSRMVSFKTAFSFLGIATAIFLGFPSTVYASWIAWNDPVQETYEIILENQVHIVMSGTLQQISISYPNGQSMEFSFENVATQLESSPTARGALIEAWIHELQSADAVSAMTGYSFPTLGLPPDGNEPNPPPGGEIIHGGGAELNAHVARQGDEIQWLPPGHGNGPIGDQCWGQSCNCFLMPCHPLQSSGRIFYMLDGGSSDGPTSEASQICRAAHFDNWQSQRQGRCRDMDDLMYAGAAAGSLLVVSCAASATLVGALGCAASTGSFVLIQRQVARAASDCFAEYPGAPDYCGS